MAMPPSVIIVMGVSGSGKTTIAALLAGLLRWEFADADAFHSEASVQKMRDGIALTDEDRWPWLRTVAAWTEEHRRSGRRAVVACSALKRSYRDILVGGHEDVRLVYLKADRETVRTRMVSRQGHFMPVALMESQFDTLEEPGADENPLVIAADGDPRAIALRAISELVLPPPR
jgi:gluconokinase